MGAVPSKTGMVAIELPADVAAAVDAHVASGEYPTQGDVVRNGLRLLNDESDVLEDPTIDRWLRSVAVPIAVATRADPGRSLSATEVRSFLGHKYPGEA